MKPDAEKSLGELEILARRSRAEMLSLRMKCIKLEEKLKLATELFDKIIIDYKYPDINHDILDTLKILKGN